MQGKYWLVTVVSIVILAAFGCRERNPYNCPDGDKCPPVGGPCSDSGECRAPTSVCDEENMTCVECLMDTDCPMSRPTCNPQKLCIECDEDADCASELCLAGGTCALPEDVAHVGGPNAQDTTECSVTTPCKTLQQALTPFRKYIKATGMITNPMEVSIDRKTVSIFGKLGMTTITRSGGGNVPVLDIRHESVVTLIDVEIVGAGDGDVIEVRDAPGPTVTMTRVKVRDAKDNGVQISAGKVTLTDSQVTSSTLAGINMTGGSLVMTGSKVFNNTLEGVKADAGTQVEIRRSSITENKGMAGVYTDSATMVVIDSSIIALNTGANGGLRIKGPLSVTNSIIASNGLIGSSSIGGVALDSSNAKFEFNTVADNTGQQGGMSCGPSLIDVSSSIFVGTLFSGTACNVTYSLTNMSPPIFPAGTGNEAGDPAFVSKSLTSPMFYRIGPGSKAKDIADPAATLNVDIDGQPRNGRRDAGADEIN